MELKDGEASKARVNQAKLKEKSQEQIHEAKSRIQALQEGLVACEQQLEIAIREKALAVLKYDCLLEDTDEERTGGVREWAQWVYFRKLAFPSMVCLHCSRTSVRGVTSNAT